MTDLRVHLEHAIRDALERHERLSPVDRAIAHVQQRRSFVKGNIGLDTEWTESHQKAIDADPSFILMNEVIRLRPAMRVVDAVRHTLAHSRYAVNEDIVQAMRAGGFWVGEQRQ